MERSWYFRFVVMLGVVVTAWLILWPSVDTWVPAPARVKELFTGRISPGLDIRGGLRLVYEVEVDVAIRDRRDVLADELLEQIGRKLGTIPGDEIPTQQHLDQTRARVRVESPRTNEKRIIVSFVRDEDVARLDRSLVTSFGDLREVSREGKRVVLDLRGERIEKIREDAVSEAVKTISNRIDELQVRETSVTSRDLDIVVEVPGADQATIGRIRQIISRTARLDFKVVDDDGASDFVQSVEDVPEGIERQVEVVSAGEQRPQASSPYFLARGDDAKQKLQAFIDRLREQDKIPEGRQLLLGEVEENPDDASATSGAKAYRTYYLFARSELTGEHIENADVAINPQDNSPYVSLNFDTRGADIFARLTGQNVKRRMAIVLDDRVESAPVIQTRIAGGRAQITLGGFRDFNSILKDANDLAIVLRAGALPAPIRPSNEQLIGPSLGKDSVEQGTMAALISIGLLLLFMLVYYETAGAIANLMMLINIVLQLAALAFFEATITLPGIAGIALTAGMAVDANVLIYERIREEMRIGKSMKSAVEQGFDRAFYSIFDSHLTTLIAGVVLFQYGTGPIKGFAVTLMIGIVSSLFTGVFCSRVAIDFLVRGLRVQRFRVG